MSRETELFSIQVPHFDQAQCKDVNPDDFFPTETDTLTITKMKTLCGKCVHRDECEQWAIDHNEYYGIWGGKTEKERGITKTQRSTPKSNRPNVNQMAAPRVVELRKQGFSRPVIAERLGIHLRGVDRALEYAKRKGMVA